MGKQAGYHTGPRRPNQKSPAVGLPSGAPLVVQPAAVVLQSGGAEAEETPEQRQAVKAVCAAVAAGEREGGYAGARGAYEVLAQSVPLLSAWKVHLELAECAKRGADMKHVKYHLAQAVLPPPRIVNVWLEAFRTLEELGELEECRHLLERSLESCPLSEQLMLKLVRILERLGDIDALRINMATLRHEPLDRVCKVLVEAAHVEVRAGHIEAARALFANMMARMPQNGLIFCEACHLEALLGEWKAAVAIAEQGVHSCTKHGPLWFSLVHLAEKASGAHAAQEFASLALRNASQELHWKFHFEVATAFSNEGNVQSSRQNVGLAALACPKHLRWKIWLLASRTELWNGSIDASRKLLARAEMDAPSKAQATVCIERARTEEFLGDAQKARASLAEAQKLESHDWKVFLESIFMEIRQGSLANAKQVALAALEVQPAFGRLWSSLATIKHSSESGGAEDAMRTLRKASQEVPKSGELWCEFARVFLNPLSSFFDLDHASKCLEFAARLTPQYGDSFLELFRLRFLCKVRRRLLADPVTAGWLSGSVVAAAENDVKRLEVAVLVAERLRKALVEELCSGCFDFGGDGTAALQKDGEPPPLHVERLEILCSYAGPNYGSLWFWSRQNALSSPREVLQKMEQEMSTDLLAGGSLWTYIWAIACRVFGLPAGGAAPGGAGFGQMNGPPLTSHDFVLGSVRLSRCFAHGSANLEKAELWRLIFGSDILCS